MAGISKSNVWESHPRVLAPRSNVLTKALVTHADALRQAKDRQTEEEAMSDWSLYWKHHPKQAENRKSSAYSSLLGKVGLLCTPKAKAKVALDMCAAEPKHKLDHQTVTAVESPASAVAIEASTNPADPDGASATEPNATPKFEIYLTELKDMLKQGRISSSDFEKLQFELNKLELEDLVQKVCISVGDFRKLKTELLVKMEDLVKKACFPEIDAQSLKFGLDDLELKHMLNSGSISKDDFHKLKFDLRRFELKGMLKKGYITASDFQVLKSECHKHELEENLVSKGKVSAGDFEALKSDLRCELNDLLEEGQLSTAAHEKLTADLDSEIGTLLGA